MKSKPESLGFETSRDLAVRRPSVYWMEGQNSCPWQSGSCNLGEWWPLHSSDSDVFSFVEFVSNSLRISNLLMFTLLTMFRFSFSDTTINQCWYVNFQTTDQCSLLFGKLDQARELLLAMQNVDLSEIMVSRNHRSMTRFSISITKFWLDWIGKRGAAALNKIHTELITNGNSTYFWTSIDAIR